MQVDSVAKGGWKHARWVVTMLAKRMLCGLITVMWLLNSAAPNAYAQEGELIMLDMKKQCQLHFEWTDKGYQAAIYGPDGKLNCVFRFPVWLTVAAQLTLETTEIRQGYDNVTMQDCAALATARVESSKGSIFVVQDRYEMAEQGVILQRRIEVEKTGERESGFQSVVSVESGDSAQEYEQLEYFVPSMLYKDSANITPTAAFAADTFLFDKNLVRETRSGLPMVMVRNPATGATFSIAHIADNVADELTPDTAGMMMRVDTLCRYGSIGITNLRGDSPAACFVYPYLETPKVYGSASRVERCFHPIKEGEKQEYRIHIMAARTEDYNAAMTMFYRDHYAAQPGRIAEVNIGQVYDVSVRDLRDLYAETTMGKGMPFAIYVDNGEAFGVNFQMGFIGMQIALAHHMIRYGIENGDDDCYQKGVAMVDFWASMAGTESGVVKVWFDSVSFRPYPPFLRIMTDGMEGMLDAYMAMIASGRKDGNLDAWINMVTRYAQFLVREQNEDGSFYRAYDYKGNVYQDTNSDGLRGDKNTLADSKLNSAIPIRFLVRMYEMTGEQKYLEAAKRAGEFVLDVLYPTGRYVGGTPDNPNTVDKEAGVYATYAYSALYSATGDARYLKAMEQAAVYTMSWAYTYSFKVANFKNIEAGVPTELGYTDGLSFIATGHSAVDSYISAMYYEMFKLYVWTEDETYRDMALFLEKNTKQTMNLDNRYGFVKESLMIEATNLATFQFHTAETRGVWLPWITAQNIEPILHMKRTFGDQSVEDFSAEHMEVLKQRLDAFGAGAKVYTFE